ncbi:MAG: sigma-70 family RNA polymerase sigma factor [Oceanospirillaceae bacterium]|nr:sigma-70 family RNA polymerase sigma factor [Oceanospirillaceae bacterium]
MEKSNSPLKSNDNSYQHLKVVTISDHQEKKILESLKSDKNYGFRLIYEHYYKRLVYLSILIVQEKSDAEEIVQSLLIDLYEKDYLYHIHTSLFSFLSKSVKNNSVRFLKRKRKNINLDAINIDLLELETTNQLDVFVERKINDLNHCISKLSPREREAVQLVYFDSNSYLKASYTMEISINTLKTLLKRGVKKLKKCNPNQ